MGMTRPVQLASYPPLPLLVTCDLLLLPSTDVSIIETCKSHVAWNLPGKLCFMFIGSTFKSNHNITNNRVLTYIDTTVVPTLQTRDSHDKPAYKHSALTNPHIMLFLIGIIDHKRQMIERKVITPFQNVRVRGNLMKHRKLRYDHLRSMSRRCIAV